MNNYYAMIMAGGGGTRLWPMSRQNKPKQVLPLVEDDSMFKISVDRLAPLFTPDRIFVVTGEQHVGTLRADAAQIPAENFIVEPYGKDSGPAAALGIAAIQRKDPNAVIAILTADHHIADKERFRQVLHAAYDIASKQDLVVTLGISPSYPATGFGYIHRGNHLGEALNFNYYHSLGFKEKPEPAIALQYLRAGRYSWNSGMFIWTATRAMAEFERQQPAIHKMMTTIAAAKDHKAFQKAITDCWETVPKISLDYAVMENADHMCVVPIDVGWSDVGSWGALYDILEQDKAGNTYRGTPPARVNIDTQETFVYSNRLVATIGVRNLAIIDTDDALLICHLDRTQEVKNIVEELKTHHKTDYL